MYSHQEIDQHVAKRLKVRRALLGLSPEALGEQIGLPFQKIQAIENDDSPITAGYLFKLSNALNVPLIYFYDGLCGNDPLEIALQELSELPPAFFEDNFFIQPENFELLGNFHRIKNETLKSDVFNLVRSASKV